MANSLGYASLGSEFDESGLMKGMDSARKTSESKLGTWGVALGNIMSNALSFGLRKIKEIGTAMVTWVKDSSEYVNIKKAFDGIAGAMDLGGLSVDGYLNKLASMGKGMIANEDIMMSFNSASQLVSSEFAGRLPEAFDYFNKIAASTGQDVSFLLDSFVKGIGRLSAPILDNLMVQVDLNQAYEDYATNIGKSVDQLTKQEKQMAATDAVMAQLKANTEDMPDVVDTFAGSMSRIKVAFKNAKDSVGAMLTEALTPLADQVADLVVEYLPGFLYFLENLVNPAADFEDAVLGLPTPLQEGAQGLLNFVNGARPFMEFIKNVPQYMKEGSLSDAIREFVGESDLPPVVQGIINTILDIIEEFPGKVGEFLATIPDKFSSAFESAKTWVQDKIDDITDYLETTEWGQFIIDSLEDAKTWVRGFSQPFSETFNQIKQNLSEVFSDFWTQLQTGDIEGAFAGLGTGIKESFSTAFADFTPSQEMMNLWNGLVTIFNTVKQVVTDVWNAFEPLRTTLQGLVEGAWADLMGTDFSTFKEGWDSLKQGVSDILPLLQFLGQVIGGIIVVAFGVLISIIGGLVNAFSPLIQTIVSFWGTTVAIFGNVLSVVGSFFNMIVAALKGNKEEMLAEWENLKTSAGELWENIKTLVVDLVTGMFDTIVGFGEGFVNTFVSFFESIGELAGGAISEFIDNGLDKIETAMNSVKTAIQNLINKVISLKDSLLKLEIPDWLTPGSPTPLEIGLVGIDKAMERVDMTVGEFGSDIAIMAAMVNGQTQESNTFTIESVQFDYSGVQLDEEETTWQLDALATQLAGGF